MVFVEKQILSLSNAIWLPANFNNNEPQCLPQVNCKVCLNSTGLHEFFGLANHLISYKFCSLPVALILHGHPYTLLSYIILTINITLHCTYFDAYNHGISSWACMYSLPLHPSIYHSSWAYHFRQLIKAKVLNTWIYCCYLLVRKSSMHLLSKFELKIPPSYPQTTL